MRRMATVLSAMALLGSVSVACFALGKFTEGETRRSFTLTCAEVNGSNGISFRGPGATGALVVAGTIILSGDGQSIAITQRDKAVEVTIGGHVIRAAELQLSTTLERVQIDNGKLLDTTRKN